MVGRGSFYQRVVGFAKKYSRAAKVTAIVGLGSIGGLFACSGQNNDFNNIKDVSVHAEVKQTQDTAGPDSCDIYDPCETRGDACGEPDPEKPDTVGPDSLEDEVKKTDVSGDGLEGEVNKDIIGPDSKKDFDDWYDDAVENYEVKKDTIMPDIIPEKYESEGGDHEVEPGTPYIGEFGGGEFYEDEIGGKKVLMYDQTFMIDPGDHYCFNLSEGKFSCSTADGKSLQGFDPQVEGEPAKYFAFWDEDSLADEWYQKNDFGVFYHSFKQGEHIVCFQLKDEEGNVSPIYGINLKTSY